MGYFIWKDTDSRQYGLLVNTPYAPKAQQTETEVTIPNRAETMLKSTENYSNVTITAVLDVRDRALMPEVNAWLHGQGNLIFSDDLGKYYKATCRALIQPEYVGYNFCHVPISFVCKPFRYAVDNTSIKLTSSGTVINNGTMYSQPIYKITGSGNVALTVNGETLAITGIDESITIDADKLIAYKDNAVLVNKTTGKYPFLAVGDNVISWSGSVTSVEITKNERWL